VRAVVLAGGRSSEHEISLASGAAVREGLVAGGHDVLAIEIGRDGSWQLDGAPVALTPGAGLLDADVVYPILHGPYGEDGTVQGLLECLDVAYVGAGVLASAVCMDKVTFKDLMAQAGVPQVGYRAVEDARWRANPDAVRAEVAELGLPVFVKPARLGSSVGIARVDAAEAVDDAIDDALAHDPRAIVEAAVRATEVECSVIGHTMAPETSQPGEIVTANEWYDYDAKYTPGGMELVLPPRISHAARDRVRALATRAFTLAGCSGMARADFFVDGEEALVNELNTMPGFTPTSVFGKLFEASGLPYVDLLDRLASIARERREANRAYRY
jgi:D-alanine-D-alanine ligase